MSNYLKSLEKIESIFDYTKTIVICESLLILSIRRLDQGFLTNLFSDGWWLVYVSAFSLFLVHFILMYCVPLQSFFANEFGIQIDLIALSIEDWIFCIICALIPIFLIELYKFNLRQRSITF